MGQVHQDLDTASSAFILMSLLRGISVHRLNQANMDMTEVKAEILRLVQKWLVA
ncbi:hypothetical protein D3C85_1856130 [compost metagenome]